jgi:uncharacterized protein (DUF2147 family)
MFKNTKISLLVLILLHGVSTGYDLEGCWFTEKKDCIVEINKNSDCYNGKIVWLKDSLDSYGNSISDTNNPNELLRSRTLIGLEILSGFRYINNQFKNGHIYDPETGNTYKCVIKQSGKDSLFVRGFIGISLIGRSECWSRADKKTNSSIK